MANWTFRSTTDDSSENNLAYQPPIQGKYRDNLTINSLLKCGQLLTN